MCNEIFMNQSLNQSNPMQVIGFTEACQISYLFLSRNNRMMILIVINEEIYNVCMGIELTFAI